MWAYCEVPGDSGVRIGWTIVLYFRAGGISSVNNTTRAKFAFSKGNLDTSRRNFLFKLRLQLTFSLPLILYVIDQFWIDRVRLLHQTVYIHTLKRKNDKIEKMERKKEQRWKLKLRAVRVFETLPGSRMNLFQAINLFEDNTLKS